MRPIFAIISSGSSVSNDLDFRKVNAIAGIAVPTITSADLLFRANFDTTSANFFRVQKAQPNTGDLRFATGPGSVWVPVPPDVLAASWGRAESGVAQADTRTLTFLVR